MCGYVHYGDADVYIVHLLSFCPNTCVGMYIIEMQMYGYIHLYTTNSLCVIIMKVCIVKMVIIASDTFSMPVLVFTLRANNPPHKLNQSVLSTHLTLSAYSYLQGV